MNIKEKVHIEEKMKKSSNSDLHLHTILKKSPSTSMPNVLGSSLLNLSALHSSTDSLTTASEAFNSPRSKRVSFSNLELAAIVNDEANGGASVVNSGVAVVHHSIADASILSSDDSEGKSPIAAVADRPVSVSPKRSHSPSRRTSPPPMLTEDDRAKKASCEKLETVTFAPVHIPGSMSPINSSGLSESQYRSLMKEIKNMGKKMGICCFYEKAKKTIIFF